MTSGHPRLVASGIVLLAAATRTSSYPVALTRDTGQMLYGGMVILHGGTPYTDAALGKGPTTYLLSALLRLIVGRSALDVRLCLLACAILAALALWRYLVHIASPRAGAIAGLAFAALAAIGIFEGEDPDLEQFAVAPMAITLLLSASKSTWSAAGCGALAAITGLMSPVFLIPLLPAAVWTMCTRGGPWRRRLCAAIAAALAVVAAVVVWLAIGGALPSFSQQFPGTSGGPPVGHLLSASRLIALPARGLWLVSLLGAFAALTQRRLRVAGLCALAWIILSWARVTVGDFLAQDPEYDHHYYPALVGMCAALGLGLEVLWSQRSRRAAGGVTAATTLGLLIPLVIVPEREAYTVPVATRGIGANPWGDANPVARWLDAHTAPNARIFVVGSEPTVLWLADRFSSTRFFDIYSISAYPPYLKQRNADLNRDPPAAIAALRFDPPDAALSQFLRVRHYRTAYSTPAGTVWLLPRGGLRA